MSTSPDTVRRLLRLSGLHPGKERVELTARLYDILSEQLAKASAESLEGVEPQCIQPTRRGPIRRPKRQS